MPVIFGCQLRKLSERTIKSYKNNSLACFSYLEKEFELVELENLSYKHIQQYLYYLSQKGLKESYINGIIKVLRAFFKYCESEQYINRNPMLEIKWQKEEVPVITTYTDEEVAKLIGAFGTSKFLDIRNKVMLIFFFDSGIRNRELCNIKLCDMHETYLTIRGKGKKLRHVPITPVMNKYLIKYLRTRES